MTEEVATTGAGEHTNVFQLLLSLLSSDFLLCPPSKLKIGTPSPGLKGKLCSETEIDVLVGAFFLKVEMHHEKALYRAGSLMASLWCSLNAAGKVLSLPTLTEVFPLIAAKAGFDPC